jgi:hypothetical protein
MAITLYQDFVNLQSNKLTEGANPKKRNSNPKMFNNSTILSKNAMIDLKKVQKGIGKSALVALNA